jgi:hypothetical protein
VQDPLKQQVFISHTGQDEGAKTFAASILKPAMFRAGLKAYMDFSNLKPGQHWKQELVNAAANSQVVVVVLSKSYTTRFWCMLELDLALNGRRPGAGPNPVIIPVFYDEWSVVCSGPDEVKRRRVLREWQWMDAEWSGEKLQQCLKDEELDVEWQACVDVVRWVENVRAMKDQFQHLRRIAFHSKDEQLAIARAVVKIAQQHVTPSVGVPDVVGLQRPSDELLAVLATGKLGLWLHGMGRWRRRHDRMHQLTAFVRRRHRQEHDGDVPVLAPVGKHA